ncbi:MAG: hypothetical protein M3376_10445 [Actinomycetota bacterium]|nr:hypothetical protein [Actinomycetota bacterium]
MPGLRELLRVLRHRDFRLLWLANSASTLGDDIVRVALALFVVDLTGARPTSALCWPPTACR